jgi:hypothetical protein
MTNKQKVSFRVLDDAEEELTLIFSFLNSKNTISSLPGPYHNVYDIQKSFKLRFDSITFEEDINMFPVSPGNSRYSYVPRPILKGSKGRNQQQGGQQHQYHLSSSQQQQQQPPPFLSQQQNDPLSSSLRRSNDFLSEEKTTSSSSNSFNNSMKHSYDEPTRTSSSTADDLYRYVGLADSKATPASLNESSMKIRDDKKSSIDNIPHPSSESQWEDDRKHPKDNSNTAHAGMSAEERLRKLMADMQRQNHFPEHLKPENHRSTSQAHHHQQQQPQQAKEAFEDPYYHSNPAISLHDLANMPVQTSIPSSGKQQPQKSEDPAFFRRSYEGGSSNRGDRDYHGKNSEISIVDLEKDDILMKSDPLAAFDIPISKTNPSSSSAGNKGPIRARHDILANSSKLPSSSSSGSSSSNPNRSSLTKQAWTSTVPSQPSSMNRPPSPSSARPSSPNMGRGVPSSNSSVGSVGSGSGKDNMIVGSGTTTSQKVYRYVSVLLFLYFYSFLLYFFCLGMEVQHPIQDQHSEDQMLLNHHLDNKFQDHQILV